MAKKLQVLINNEWKWVFCRNELKKDPITTENRLKALPGRAILYFQEKFANHQFRIQP